MTSMSNVHADPRRLVVLEAVHNFRDLGGYPTSSGRVTRWGLLFRADGLYRLTDVDVEVVKSLGLRTVVDLRTHAELERRGGFPRDRIDVTFTHLPVIDTTWRQNEQPVLDSDHEFLLCAYRDMLRTGAPRFGQAIVELARPGALPAVFHCAAGKDRTGIVAAFILSVLGVPREYVLGDYALTAAGMERMRAWAQREFPEMAERVSETPSAFLAALPEALDDLLCELTDEHGSIDAYLRAIGVSDDAFVSLERQLLADPLTSLA